MATRHFPEFRNRNMKHTVATKAGGFTLIELMVSMVIGLIVIGAVMALVLSMVRSNKETIAATRLTQELRATSALITSELQRAGSSGNPFDITSTLALGTVNTSTAGCIIYNYGNAAGTTVNRAISLSGGAVYMGTTACGSSGTKLSSNSVSISALTFSRTGQSITVTLTGHMPDDPTTAKDEATIVRSYTQTVFAPGLGTT